MRAAFFKNGSDLLLGLCMGLFVFFYSCRIGSLIRITRKYLIEIINNEKFDEYIIYKIVRIIR